MTGGNGGPPATTEGLLELVPVPTLFHRLYRARATGVLALESAKVRHELILASGCPISVTLGGDAVDPLGRILLELGKIGDREYQASLSTMASSHRRHGEILREMGAISEDDLQHGLQVQLRRKLNRLFYLRGGRYAFTPSTAVDDGGPRLHPLPVILNGIRTAYDDERIDELLRPLEGLEIRLQDGFQSELESLVLQPGERALLGALAHFRSVANLIDARLTSEMEARQLLTVLLLVEALELRDATSAWDARLRPPPLEVPASAPTEGARPSPTEGARSSATSAASSASQAPRKTARSEAAPPPSDDDEDRRMPPRAVRTINPPPIAPKPERKPTPDRPTPLGRLATKKKEVEKPLTTAELEAALTLKEKQIQTADFYTLLELDREANAEEVKQAYFRLAKRFHPDRFLAAELRSLRRRAENVFERIGEAHDTLRDDDKRREYLELLNDDRVKGDRRRAQTVAQSDGHFARARELMTKAEWSAAEDALHRAITMYGDDPDYHAALGWAIYQNPETPQRLRRTNAQKPLLRALQLRPNHERSHLTLARIYELEGQVDDAARHYQKVLEVNDRNPDAAAALVRLRGGGAPR